MPDRAPSHDYAATLRAWGEHGDVSTLQACADRLREWLNDPGCRQDRETHDTATALLHDLNGDLDGSWGQTRGPKPSSCIHVASSEFIHAPGLWEWYVRASHDQPDEWKREFLAAFTANRLTPEETEAILAGRYSVAIGARKADTVSITITL